MTYVDAQGDETSYTYRHVRLGAAALARRLHLSGVRRGSLVAVDLPNCPAFVLLVLAAAYGSFSLVTINGRLSEKEKLKRLLEIERTGQRVTCTIGKDRADDLMGKLLETFGSSAEMVSSVIGSDARDRVIMGVRQDAVEDTVHFAEREAHVFDPAGQAVIMFTSGTTGKPKAVPHSWRELVGASRSANAALSCKGQTLWQAVLPFYHIGGFQVIVRSVLNRSPLRVYARFDPERLLHDAQTRRVTHVSVVDKMLQDMIAFDGGRLSLYQCILLGGGPLNPRTVELACNAGARVYASYGMTETSSQIACSPITLGFAGGMRLLNGYSARIVEPDAEGFGRLAVKGPGVFEGYLNERAAFTVDGFFLTGDTAALYQGHLFVKERTSDMFVSGGENVYPAEIADALRRVPGVADAYVFGVPDERWGRRPVAVVERSHAGLLPDDVRRGLGSALSKLNTPEDILVVDSLPRSGIGKVDRAAAEGLYEGRLCIERVVLSRVRLPFKKPFATAKAVLDHRDSLVLEAIDREGRTGLGECVAFDTDWYLPETLDQDIDFIRGALVPAVRGRSFAHPRDVSAALMRVPGAERLPMAVCALEMAFWDLYGRMRKQPLWKLVNEEYERVCERIGHPYQAQMLPRAAVTRGQSALVASGAVVGIATAAASVAEARCAVAAGYHRVKMKIAPGGEGLESVRAVRAAFPQLLVTLDANQSFSERDIDELRRYDELGIGWIEEPVGAGFGDYDDAGVQRGVLTRLNALQCKVSTPLCVDESFATGAGAFKVLRLCSVSCIAVKIGKFGGIEPALRFIVEAQAQGREVWMGGMYDLGVSKRMHAAFETLPGVIMPGDIGAIDRYFETDVTDPPYEVRRGYVMLNDEGHPYGLGCDLDRNALAKVLVKRTVV